MVIGALKMGSQKRQGSDSVWPLRNAKGLTFAEVKAQRKEDDKLSLRDRLWDAEMSEEWDLVRELEEQLVDELLGEASDGH
jgi:hypothetical protein